MPWGSQIEGAETVEGAAMVGQGTPVSDINLRLQAMNAIDPHFHDPVMGNGAAPAGGKGSHRGK